MRPTSRSHRTPPDALRDRDRSGVLRIAHPAMAAPGLASPNETSPCREKLMAPKGLLKPEYARHATIKAVPTLLDRLSFEHRQIKHLWVELQRAHNEQVFGRFAPDSQRIG